MKLEYTFQWIKDVGTCLRLPVILCRSISDLYTTWHHCANERQHTEQGQPDKLQQADKALLQFFLPSHTHASLLLLNSTKETSLIF